MTSDYKNHIRQLCEHRAEQINAIGRSYDFTHHCETVAPSIPLPEKPHWMAEFERKTARWDRRLRAAAFEAEFNRRDKEKK